MQHWSLIFIIIFLLIIIVPVTLKFRITFDVNKNFGVFSFKFAKFRFKLATYKFKKASIQITSGNKTKKISEIELSVTKEQIVYVKELAHQLKDKIKIRRMFFASRIGTGDAFETAMICASLEELVCCGFAYIKNFKQTASISTDCVADYDKKSMFFALNLSIGISIYDLFYCFLFAAIRKWRFEKNEKRLRKQKFN